VKREARDRRERREASDSGTKYASRDSETSELVSLKAHQEAWEAFATCAVSMIPILKKQMVAVTQQTERAAMDLMLHVSALTSSAKASRHTDTSANLSKVVMAMQFQDITQQKLEHVTQALDQWQKHLQALLKGPQDEGAKQEIAALQRLEESYTMEEERRLHATALAPDYQEPVPIETAQTERDADSVTLF
jgi:ABC-type multidrug transport system fused ATPase/permease subunit